MVHQNTLVDWACGLSLGTLSLSPWSGAFLLGSLGLPRLASLSVALSWASSSLALSLVLGLAV
jgi:hypothetical protein